MRLETVGKRQAFTLVEQMIFIMVAGIVILGMGMVLVDSQRGWNRMFNRVYGDVVTDGYAARKTFDAVVRKSSIKREIVGNGEAEVYYYDDPQTSARLDRYAKFYTKDGNLLVDYGQLDTRGIPMSSQETVTLAHNIEAVSFSVSGVCVQMILKLNNGSESVTVMSSAIRHNE